MEVNNCVDINGVALNEVFFNVDGTVVGILDSGNGQINSNLSYDCCIAQGWVFDPTDTKCYWTETCSNDGTYNIILNPEGNSGALFQVDDNQLGLCKLELEFDWLLRFDCEKNVNGFRDVLEAIKLVVNIEKVILSEESPLPINLEVVASEVMFNVDDIFNYFDGNTNTGILLSNENGYCDSLHQNLLNDLEPNSAVINEDSLNSGWVKFKLVIDNPEILETIYNERLTISIQGNTLNNFAILIDDIKLNRVCELPKPPRYLNEECPKFELRRLIDNKKSWVSNSEVEVRDFDLSRRKTRYVINNERLAINTKEVDIAINTSQAVNNDVFKAIITNPCLLGPSTGCTSGNTTHICVDLLPLITKPLTEIIDNDELMNMLIDAKSRKTISAYPVIELIYHRYKNSFEHCGIDINSLDVETLDSFVNLMGTYWTDLIEQLVPATTIWGSSLTNGNGIFGDYGSNKYVYRKYTSLPCYGITYPVPSPSNSDIIIDVLTEDITNSDNIITQRCSNLSIRQINDGSEFIGTVTIIGDGEGPTSGSTISITEIIVDECNKFENC